jgi:hypothetical protein
MPAKMRKNKSGYSVSTPNMVHAKNTTKEKAESQVRLLNAIDHGWQPSKDPYRAENRKYSPKRRRKSNAY